MAAELPWFHCYWMLQLALRGKQAGPGPGAHPRGRFSVGAGT